MPSAVQLTVTVAKEFLVLAPRGRHPLQQPQGHKGDPLCREVQRQDIQHGQDAAHFEELDEEPLAACGGHKDGNRLQLQGEAVAGEVPLRQ